ncbi:hypothetical protein GCM10029964_078430 [Kibdelosporangium lantanae]
MFGDEPVAELQHLRQVVAGVHVQQRERDRHRPERLHRQADEHSGVLAAGEQDHRAVELPATSRKMWTASDSSASRSLPSVRAVVVVVVIVAVVVAVIVLSSG